MRRQDRYPDTKTFHWVNVNPRKRITGDCVCRAITAATELPYDVVAKTMLAVWMETGYCTLDVSGIPRVMERLGWVRMPQPRKSDNTKYTGKEFCEKLAKKGARYVANIGGHHAVAIVDKKVWDIWDSTNGCIGMYWVKG